MYDVVAEHNSLNSSVGNTFWLCVSFIDTYINMYKRGGKPKNQWTSHPILLGLVNYFLVRGNL